MKRLLILLAAFVATVNQSHAALGKYSLHAIYPGEHVYMVCATYNTHPNDYQTWSEMWTQCLFNYPGDSLMTDWEAQPVVPNQAYTPLSGWQLTVGYSCPGSWEVAGDHRGWRNPPELGMQFLGYTYSYGFEDFFDCYW